MMKSREITSFADLDQSFEEFHRFQGWVYRGQPDLDWPLIPKLARAPMVTPLSLTIQTLRDQIGEIQARLSSTFASLTERFQLPRGMIGTPHDCAVIVEEMQKQLDEITQARQETVLLIERTALENWKRNSIPYLKERPTYDWEWLAIGQHYGLKTRLLDWTSNPLAATFFALCDNRETPAAIYALRCKCKVDVSVPLAEFKGVAMYSPPRAFDRIIRQNGLFSVTEEPCRDLTTCENDEAELVQLIIPAPLRDLLLRKVVSFGVDRSTLFPDLDGAAAHINWCLDHPALLTKGTPHLDRALEPMYARLKVLMESIVTKLSVGLSGLEEPPLNLAFPADGEVVIEQ